MDPPLLGTLVEKTGDLAMIGVEHLPNPGVLAVDRHVPISGNVRGLAQRSDEILRIGRAVAVRHQSRVALQHGGRVQSRRKPPGNLTRADVPRDVALQVLRAETQRSERDGNRPPRVFAGQEQRRAAGRVK